MCWTNSTCNPEGFRGKGAKAQTRKEEFDAANPGHQTVIVGLGAIICLLPLCTAPLRKSKGIRLPLRFAALRLCAFASLRSISTAWKERKMGVLEKRTHFGLLQKQMQEAYHQ